MEPYKSDSGKTGRESTALSKRAACEGDCEKTRARKTAKLFYGLFYGRAKFCCKTAQFTATLCEYRIAEIRSIHNAVQHCENECKNSFFNYESPALPLSYRPAFLT